METVGIALLALLGLILIIGTGWATLYLLVHREYVESILALLCFLLCAGTACLIYADEHKEQDNPCIAWGPPVTTMMLVGKIMVPVTHTPCIRRQNETDK